MIDQCTEVPGGQSMKAYLLLLAALSFAACAGHAQQPTSPQSPQAAPAGQPASDDPEDAVSPNGNLETSINAELSDEPRRKFVKWNEYHGPYFTGRWGAGLLLEVAGYSQDKESKQQIELHPDQRLRDFRFILGGRILPKIERKITWSAGIMYDAPTHSWLIRQTGVMIAVPELWGNFFVGRSKEGFSLNKVMTGYDGWTMERSPINDASIPILADGIKWLGYSPKHKFLWNAGYFNDVFSKDQSFSTYSSQVVARFAVLPILSDEKAEVLHLGVNFRWGRPEDNKIRLRSRPEAFPAPYFIDTGSFPSDATYMPALKSTTTKTDGSSVASTGGCLRMPRQVAIPCSMAETSLRPIFSTLRLALTTPLAGTLKRHPQSALCSKAAPAHGNWCSNSRIPISTAERFAAAGSRDSPRW